MCYSIIIDVDFPKSEAKLEKLCNLELWLVGIISALY
jgi:hypothetical protein